jgi:thiol-disulfide isomerase/thioredoxin
MRVVLKNLMRRNPAIFNPLWAFLYPEYLNGQQAFQTIFEENRWGSSESRSGRGSTLAYTKRLRPLLERYLKTLNVEVFLDVPCGDFNWMKYVTLPHGTRYIGGDIVAPLVHDLQKKYGNERYSFHTIDIVEGPLPNADLWLCRDVLFHLPNQDIQRVFRNFVAAAIPYILTTTYSFSRKNDDVKAGGFRFINLRLPPFMLPPPLSMVPDFVAPEPPRYLGLWSRE